MVLTSWKELAYREDAWMDTKITDMEAALGEDRINAQTICFILTAAALILVLSAITPISMVEIV